MRYLLTTGNRAPKFYKSDGSIVTVELDYIETKTLSSIDELGQLSHTQVKGVTPCVDGLWMVSSIEDSLQRLADKGVYPFITKAAAKQNAKRLRLSSFKYIAVP